MGVYEKQFWFLSIHQDKINSFPYCVMTVSRETNSGKRNVILYKTVIDFNTAIKSFKNQLKITNLLSHTFKQAARFSLLEFVLHFS